VDVIAASDDELIDAKKSQWYKELSSKKDPGLNIKIYRELHHFTQEELGRRMGTVSRQSISNMEKGRRPISKASAKKLAMIFNVSVEKFI
jgi:DNA-binding XRE family transcriptional regulator